MFVTDIHALNTAIQDNMGFADNALAYTHLIRLCYICMNCVYLNYYSVHLREYLSTFKTWSRLFRNLTIKLHMVALDDVVLSEDDKSMLLDCLASIDSWDRCLVAIFQDNVHMTYEQWRNGFIITKSIFSDEFISLLIRKADLNEPEWKHGLANNWRIHRLHGMDDEECAQAIREWEENLEDIETDNVSGEDNSELAVNGDQLFPEMPHQKSQPKKRRYSRPPTYHDRRASYSSHIGARRFIIGDIARMSHEEPSTVHVIESQCSQVVCGQDDAGLECIELQELPFFDCLAEQHSNH